MGLDLECNGYWVRAGTYSYVHLHKSEWIKAAIKYIKKKIISMSYKISNDTNFVNFPNISIDDEKINVNVITDYIANGKYEISSQVLIDLEQTSKLYNKIVNVIIDTEVTESSNQSNINYNLLKTIKEEMIYSGLIGVYLWVNHSACDGYLTPGQCYDIIDSLNKIARYIEENECFCDPNNYNNTEVKEKVAENYYLYKILKESIKSKQLIIFS